VSDVDLDYAQARPGEPAFSTVLVAAEDLDAMEEHIIRGHD
jgi:hypothetical protein